MCAVNKCGNAADSLCRADCGLQGVRAVCWNFRLKNLAKIFWRAGSVAPGVCGRFFMKIGTCEKKKLF